MQNKDALKNAYNSIKDLKDLSLESLNQNHLTYSKLSRHSGISRNNLSSAYIEKYPEWLLVRNEIDDFKVEFEELKSLKKNNPIISELELKLDKSYQQNIELLAEIKDLSDDKLDNINRISSLQREKENLDKKLKVYIDKFGLIKEKL